MDETRLSERLVRTTNRRRFLRQAVGLGLLASGGSGMLAACAPAPAPPAAPATAAPAPAAGGAAAPPAAAAKPAAPPAGMSGEEAARITFWHTFADPLDKKLAQLVDQYNAAQPRVKVSLVFGGRSYVDMLPNLLPAIASGSAPDLVQTSTVAELARKGVLQPLDGAIEPADFVPGLLEENHFEEKLYGLPFARSTPLLFYNARLLREAGLDKTFLSDWSNFESDDCKKLVRGPGAETPRVAYSAAPAWWFWTQLVWAYGGEMSDLDGTVRFDQGPAVDALRDWQKLIHVHRVARTDEWGASTFESWEKSRIEWLMGRAVVTVQSSAFLTTMLRSAAESTLGGKAEKEPFEADVAPMPGRVTRAVPYGGANLVLMASSKQQEPALHFMRWLTSPEQTAAWHTETGYLPVRTSALQSSWLKEWFSTKAPPQVRPEQLKVAIDQLAVARTAPVISQMPRFEDPIARELLHKVVVNPGDLKSALEEAKTATERDWKEFTKRL